MDRSRIKSLWITFLSSFISFPEGFLESEFNKFEKRSKNLIPIGSEVTTPYGSGTVQALKVFIKYNVAKVKS